MSETITVGVGNKQRLRGTPSCTIPELLEVYYNVDVPMHFMRNKSDVQSKLYFPENVSGNTRMW